MEVQEQQPLVDFLSGYVYGKTVAGSVVFICLSWFILTRQFKCLLTRWPGRVFDLLIVVAAGLHAAIIYAYDDNTSYAVKVVFFVVGVVLTGVFVFPALSKCWLAFNRWRAGHSSDNWFQAEKYLQIDGEVVSVDEAPLCVAAGTYTAGGVSKTQFLFRGETLGRNSDKPSDITFVSGTEATKYAAHSDRIYSKETGYTYGIYLILDPKNLTKVVTLAKKSIIP